MTKSYRCCQCRGNLWGDGALGLVPALCCLTHAFIKRDVPLPRTSAYACPGDGAWSHAQRPELSTCWNIHAARNGLMPHICESVLKSHLIVSVRWHFVSTLGSLEFLSYLTEFFCMHWFPVLIGFWRPNIGTITALKLFIYWIRCWN